VAVVVAAELSGDPDPGRAAPRVVSRAESTCATTVGARGPTAYPAADESARAASAELDSFSPHAAMSAAPASSTSVRERARE
jgi:hypothetical protein